jgi:hypothetical protein
MTHLTANQHILLTKEITKIIERAQTEVNEFAARLGSNPLMAFDSRGESALKAAAILADFPPILEQLNQDGQGFDIAQRERIFNRMLRQQSEDPTLYGGLINPAVRIAKHHALAKLIGLFQDISEIQ